MTEARALFSAGTILSLLVFFVPGCGGSAGSPTPAVTFHGEVTDATGDAIAGNGVAVPPDLIHAIADVTGGTITFTIQLAPGTFDRQSTRVTVLLDTDQDGSTGIRQLDGLGADYSVELIAAASQATVMKANQTACIQFFSCFDAVGSAAIAFVQDGMQVAVPLSLLGNDDGRMNFQMLSNVLLQLTPSPALPVAVTFDAMPDSAAPPTRVQ